MKIQIIFIMLCKPFFLNYLSWTYQITMCRYRYNDNQNLVHVAQEQAINVRLINIPMPWTNPGTAGLTVGLVPTATASSFCLAFLASADSASTVLVTLVSNNKITKTQYENEEHKLMFRFYCGFSWVKNAVHFDNPLTAWWEYKVELWDSDYEYSCDK